VVYFKRVVVKNLRTGEEIECPSRYDIYIMKALEGDTIKVILDIAGADESMAGLRIYAFGKEYNEALEGRSHIEKTFTAHDLPGTISILVGHYYPTPEDVLHVDDQRDIEFRQAPEPMPILHLEIPERWEPSCDSFPCSISFTGKVYDATGQHKYANCDITATIEDLDTGELSTVQTTTDAEGKFRITFKVKKPGKKKITVVAHTPDGDAEAETTINVTGVLTAISKFVDKETECYIVDKYGNCYYPGQTIKEEGEKVVLRCCGLIKNIGNNEGECGMYVYDKKAKKYYDGATKVLKPNEMWLAIVDIVLSEGEYELEFHAVHKDESGKYVVDDTVG